jgi:hypothetical protein
MIEINGKAVSISQVEAVMGAVALIIKIKAMIYGMMLNKQKIVVKEEQVEVHMVVITIKADQVIMRKEVVMLSTIQM